MKKVMLFVMSMLFAVSSSAATLTWVAPFDSEFEYSAPGATIGATDTYSVEGSTTHEDKLYFTSDENVMANSVALEFFDDQLDVSGVTLNGFAFTDSVVSTLAGQMRVWTLNNIALVAGEVNNIVIGMTALGAGQWNVQVSAVPVPAALILFAPALLGFLGLRRKATALVA